MDFSIALLLIQDGITNGAIYALLALALVLVFTVTKIIFIPQGEFVAWGALTLAAIQGGHFPGTSWILIFLGTATFIVDAMACVKQRTYKGLPKSLANNFCFPLLLMFLLSQFDLVSVPLIFQILITLIIIIPMGPMIYRVVYQPIADASVLVLLIISVALHLAMTGIGLLVFGPEGSRTTAFTDFKINLGPLNIGGQSLVMVGVSVLLIAGLYLFFNRSLYGKALRATALNRIGARLMGISPTLAGKLTFLLAAFIGVISGVLISPNTTIYYDSGFLVALKGFVAAIIGGLSSYPIAALGAIIVGIIESFSSFWASAFKEVIVFTLIIPVLLWFSLRSHHLEDDE